MGTVRRARPKNPGMTGNPGSASGTGRQTPTAGTEHHPSGALLVGTATLRGDHFAVRQLVLADQYPSPSRPSGSRKKMLCTGPKSLMVPSLASWSINRCPMVANASVKAACRPTWSMWPRPPWGLPVGLGVALDHQDVQPGVRADADDGYRLVTVVPVLAGWSDLGVEDLGIEPAQPGGVLGQPGDVVDAIE